MYVRAYTHSHTHTHVCMQFTDKYGSPGSPVTSTLVRRAYGYWFDFAIGRLNRVPKYTQPKLSIRTLSWEVTTTCVALTSPTKCRVIYKQLVLSSGIQRRKPTRKRPPDIHLPAISKMVINKKKLYWKTAIEGIQKEALVQGILQNQEVCSGHHQTSSRHCPFISTEVKPQVI